MSENYISDTSLRGERIGRVRDLTGFTRFHRDPEEHGPRARDFVQKAGSENVAEQATLLFQSIRKGFRYKRKEISLACDGGGASIKTPDFDVALTIDQDPKVAANYRITTEVAGFRNADIVDRPHFTGLFAAFCDRVVIDFANPIDMEDRIDAIEENDDLAECLDFSPDYSWLVLRLPRLVVEVTPSRMTCKLPGEGNLGELIAQTQEALHRLSGAGVVSDAIS